MNKKLKIIFFADAAAEHSMRWAKFFADLGYEVHLLSWNIEGGSGSYRQRSAIIKQARPVIFHYIGPSGLKGNHNNLVRVFSILIKSYRLVRKINPDVIHSHSVGAYSWITLLFSKYKIIITPWGTDVLIDMEASRIHRFLSILTLNKSKLITTDAIHMKKKLMEYDIESEKIKIINFGTDIKKFKKNEVARKRIRDKYNISDEDVIVISTRTLNPIHDVFTVLKAISIVNKINSKIKFIIASDGTERRAMERFVSESGISSITYFPGYMTIEEMVEFLSASDIYVSSSIADAGLAASTAEAMSIKLPVIVTDNADNRYWVDEVEAGLLFANEDSQSLADNILQLGNNESLRKRFGDNGRLKIKKDCNYYLEMEKMHEIYKTM